MWSAQTNDWISGEILEVGSAWEVTQKADITIQAYKYIGTDEN